MVLMLTYAGCLGLAFVVTFALTPIVRALARRSGALDHPDSHRKLHRAPIPRLGGICVFAGFYAGVWLVVPSTLDSWAPGTAELARASTVPAFAIFLLGVADDLWPVRPVVKILVQMAAGLWVIYTMDIRIQFVSNPFDEQFFATGFLSIPATLVWIVLITNAFNIVDGMDGLAAGVGLIATTCMFLVSLQMGIYSLAAVSACLAGALLGFLPFNLSPASIFLGDSGSLFLGFVLAIFSVAGYQKSSTAIAIAGPMLMMGLPLLETLTSTVRRFLQGQSIMQADRGHIHHQLMHRGLTPKQAAIILYLGSALFGAASLFIVHAGENLVGVTAFSLAALAFLAVQKLGYAEFIEVNQAIRRGFLHQRQIIQKNIAVRRLADQLRESHSLSEAFQLLSGLAEGFGFSGLQIRVVHPSGGRYAPNESLVWRDRGAGAIEDAVRTVVIKLTSRSGVIGEVTLTWVKEDGTRHAELPLLVEIISDCLPPVLDTGRGGESVA